MGKRLRAEWKRLRLLKRRQRIKEKRLIAETAHVLANGKKLRAKAKAVGFGVDYGYNGPLFYGDKG